MTITCGHLLVPEERSIADSPTIELFVAILRSRGAPKADPIVVLPGGPGGSALDLRTHFYPLSLRDDRDVILLEPRGAGESTPSLDCFELETQEPATTAMALPAAACAKRLIRDGRNLNAYSTAASAQDVADLAHVLGLEQINLFAVSYGTRVAMRVAEHFPLLVRSMALDSVLPPSVNALLEEPLTGWLLIRRIERDCAADPACSELVPNLHTDLLALIDRHNRVPFPDDLGYGTGDDLLRLLVKDVAQGGARLPAFVAALDSGDYAAACALIPPETGCFFGDDAEGEGDASAGQSPPVPGTAAAGDEWRTLFVRPEDPEGPDAERLTWLMQQVDAPTPVALFAALDAMEMDSIRRLLETAPELEVDGLSEGAFASVLCSEDAPLASSSLVERVAMHVPRQFRTLAIEHASAVESLCGVWPVADASPEPGERSSLQTPALLLSGTHDPITPPSWARRASETLEQSAMIPFPGFGHVLITTGEPCLDDLLARFYTAPEAFESPACLETLKIEWEGLPE